jgi:hypothetical protein
MDRSSSSELGCATCARGAIMAAPEFFYQENQNSSKMCRGIKKFCLSFTMYLW